MYFKILDRLRKNGIKAYFLTGKGIGADATIQRLRYLLDDIKDMLEVNEIKGTSSTRIVVKEGGDK